MFVNRIEELELLENRLRSERAEFIVVYGRRRIGKTALCWSSYSEKSEEVFGKACRSFQR